MQASTVRAAVRERLGEPGTAALVDLLEAEGKAWKTDVLATATDRFERRLTDECGKIRVEMTNGFAALRQDMTKGLADVRLEIIKWSFAFWLAQIITIAGLFLRAR